jgi:hypothetical protein
MDMRPFSGTYVAYSEKNDREMRIKSGNRRIKALQTRAKPLIINGFAASFGPQVKSIQVAFSIKY